MSRHARIEGMACCASPRSVAVDWESFLIPQSGTPSGVSPIDEFYASHTALIKLSRLVDSPPLDADASALLGGQILLGYVSATELYLRRSVSTMVRLCPYLRRANGGQMISFGAIDYYGPKDLEHALTERVSFSEPGTIKKQLNGLLDLSISNGTSIERSISDFEKLCQLRHALVHSHGVMNSRNAAELLGDRTNQAQRTQLDQQCLEWVASVSLNLVRDVNLELLKSTLWRWVVEGFLTGDGRKDRPRIQRLVIAVGSAVDEASGRISPPLDQMPRLVRNVISEIAGGLEGRRSSRRGSGLSQ